MPSDSMPGAFSFLRSQRKSGTSVHRAIPRHPGQAGPWQGTRRRDGAGSRPHPARRLGASVQAAARCDAHELPLRERRQCAVESRSVTAVRALCPVRCARRCRGVCRCRFEAIATTLAQRESNSFWCCRLRVRVPHVDLWIAQAVRAVDCKSTCRGFDSRSNDRRPQAGSSGASPIRDRPVRVRQASQWIAARNEPCSGCQPAPLPGGGRQRDEAGARRHGRSRGFHGRRRSQHRPLVAHAPGAFPLLPPDARCIRHKAATGSPQTSEPDHQSHSQGEFP